MHFRSLLSLIALLTATELHVQAAVTLAAAPTVGTASSAQSFSVSGVSALAGDYIVISTATNKNTTNAPLSGTWTGSGSITALSQTQTAAAYLFFVPVTTDGIYDLTVTSSNQTFTANYASFILRPGAGETLSMVDTAVFSSASTSSADLGYSYTGSLTPGSAVAIESFSGGTFTRDSDYLQAFTGGSGARVGTYSTSVSGENWTSTNALTPSPGAMAAVGGIFAVSSVPEPSRALLMLIGLLSFTSSRRRP